MKHTRLIAMMLVLCMVACLMPARASAADVAGGTCGENVNWSFSDDGILTISGYGDMMDYDETQPSFSHAPWIAEQLSVHIKNVVIEEGVTSIGEYAFYGLDELVSVQIPETVVDIGTGAFIRCENLVEITLPEGLTELGYRVFEDCFSLPSINIPDGIPAIRQRTFSGCFALADVKISENCIIDHIGPEAFYNCACLTGFTIPNNVRQIGTRTFQTTGISTITIPTSVTNIDDSAFSSCIDLNEMIFEGDAPDFGENVFYNVNLTAYYPHDNSTWTEEVMQDYGGTVTWSPLTPEPDNYGYCGANVTWELYRDTGVLTISGTGAMFDYDYDSDYWSAEEQWITSVVVNEGVTTIGNCAFYHLDNLSSVSLPEGLQTIGEGAFSCTAITEIEIPASVTQLYADAFKWCMALETINVDVANEHYCNDDQGILYDKDMMTLLRCPQGFAGECAIPEGVEVIAENAFYDCEKLTAVQMADTVTTIGEYAFYESWALEKAVLSKNLEVIGEAAFADCPVLKEIVFRGSAPMIAENAFEGVSADVYYPFNEKSWTDETTVNYGGTLTWIQETYLRVFGAGRSETAIAAAEELKAVLGIEKFDSIILAGGEGFADALAGSYLAVQKDAPILLVRASTIELNKNYVLDNLTEGGTVYILGGTAAVPQTMEDALAGLNVVRLQGDDRFLTNLKILEEAGIDDEEILICTGWNFADSLSASATGLPILMLNTSKNELTNEQTAFLEKYADNKFTIIGGTAAVSEKLEADVEAIVGEADRVSGSTREETSVKVAKRYFSVPDYAVVAYSRNFPDGLCGGPLAHALKAPLLLVNVKCETPAADYIESQGITQGFVLGGTAAVSEDSARIVFDLK